MASLSTEIPAAGPAISPAPVLSIVTPAYNEAESVRLLWEKISSVLNDSPWTFEVIYIDDGSSDNTWEKIRQLQADYPQGVRAFRLRRNFGKAAALSVGFSAARGDYVITMDADLQDEPGEIPSLMAKLEEGYDLVSGWKRERNDPLEKRLPSRLFNAVTRKISGLELHDFNCGLKAYRVEVVRELPLYGELHRYIPILAHAEGYRVTEIPVKHHAREFGISKYGLGRYFKGFLDLLTVAAITRFLQRPGHLFGGSGLVLGGLGFLILCYLTAVKLFLGAGIGQRPLLLFGVLLMLLGVQLISVGLVGELIVRKLGGHREAYQVRETLG
ncbi:glycosyltransferase family 2 protein [Cerasicoccus arenae]|uniref:Glycosyl transferase family 2 n=1 Tax=Cerasicoccus arenae TaxID=424488 RepID=A0A8J3DDF9_9BACT|nr:glycosyltransferase family 2 protein [Cerasicoccus arenae]MBK1858053.1 glycosyltransferase family 2 protein [Cerasicoccus arenae]GHC06769.1 glycosyl transferase family 2 [Cerasicoccus arenae]